MKSIGERVRDIRENLNMSKTQFGKMIGISGQYLGMVERGVHGLSVDSVINICQKTGISADYILFGDPSSMNGNISAVLNGLNSEQLYIAFDIIKKVVKFVNTEDGNELLIREVASQQRASSF